MVNEAPAPANEVEHAITEITGTLLGMLEMQKMAPQDKDAAKALLPHVIALVASPIRDLRRIADALEVIAELMDEAADTQPVEPTPAGRAPFKAV